MGRAGNELSSVLRARRRRRALPVRRRSRRREVTPSEQYVHGFLGRVPMMATFLLTVLHWDQARAAIGLRGRPDWRLKPKRRPLSRGYVAGNFAFVGCAGRAAVCRGTGAVREGRPTPIGSRSCLTPSLNDQTANRHGLRRPPPWPGRPTLLAPAAPGISGNPASGGHTDGGHRAGTPCGSQQG